MKIIGVDPGLNGGIAMYCSGSYRENQELIVMEIPTLKSSTGRGNEILWAELVDTFDVMFDGAQHAFIERVQAMPGNGASSMFKFGYVAGGIRGILAAKRIPVTMVQPAKWKHAMGLGKSKDVAVSRACELWPDSVSSFRGPKGGNKDGPAEAALIAKYGHDTLLRTD